MANKNNSSLERICERILSDSVTEKLVSGETLTLKELFMLRNKIDNLIQENVLSNESL